MLIGKLNRRIAIQSATDTRGTAGQVLKTWATDDLRWAGIEPLSGKEALAAKQIQAETTHRIIIRYYSGLTTQHRFVLGSRIFNILSILDPDDKHEQQQCLCVEAV